MGKEGGAGRVVVDGRENLRRRKKTNIRRERDGCGEA